MDHHEHSSSSNDAVEYGKFTLVIAAVLIGAWFASGSHSAFDVKEFLQYFMGFFFLVFAGFKFVGYKMFVEMFKGYDIAAKRIPLYSNAYPFLELFLAFLFLTATNLLLANIITVVIMVIGLIGVSQEIYFKRSSVRCACLGNVIKLPLSTVTLVEDVTMFLMAAAMIILL